MCCMPEVGWGKLGHACGRRHVLSSKPLTCNNQKGLCHCLLDEHNRHCQSSVSMLQA